MTRTREQVVILERGFHEVDAAEPRTFLRRPADMYRHGYNISLLLRILSVNLSFSRSKGKWNESVAGR